MSGYRPHVFLCVILSYVTVFAYNSCDKLKVFSGKKEIQSSTFCIAEYSDDECFPFVQSFNKSDLPIEFHFSSLTVERPSKINLVGLVNNKTEGNILFKVPGVRVQWNSPISEKSRKHLEGFLLTSDQDAKTTMCRLFKFKSESLDFLKMMTFSYDIDNLKSDSPYTFTVYSVPLPDTQFQNDSSRYVQMMMHTFIKYKHATDPADWTPSVSMQTLPSGTIEVKFTLSPPEFNLTKFDILLMKKSYSITDYFEKKSFNGLLFTTSQPEGKVFFEGLSTDNYQIKVHIKDPFRYDDGLCYCWKLDMNSLLCPDNRCCSNTCGVMSTQWFYMKVIDSTKTATAAQVSSVDPRTAKTAEVSFKEMNSNSLNDGEIAAISVGLVLLTMILIVLIVYCKNVHCSPPYLKALVSFKELPRGDKQSIFSITTQSSGSPAPLTTKKLYLMTADDHSCHIQMVESLVQFLQLHCQCHVVYPQSAQDIHMYESPYTWFISNISTTDYIIFVTSVGAEKLIEAHVSRKTYRDRELRPEGDLFTECLKYIFKDRKARDKVINIHFGDTKMESEYMKSTFTYSIPKNLPEFILKLHALNSIDQQMYNSKLPLSCDNIQHLAAGGELLKAIEVSSHYEEINPDWLMTNFGHETEIEHTFLGNLTEILNTSKGSPRLETMLSVDSGITDMGPRSVSASDFSHYPSPSTDEDYSSFCKEKDFFQNCEMPLSIFTVECSGVINELIQISGEDFQGQGCNVNLPFNKTEAVKSGCPDWDCSDHFSDSCKNFGGVAYDDSIFVLENTSVDVITKMTCIEKSVAGTDPPLIDQDCLISAFNVKPPETISAITDLSGEFWDVNRTNGYF